MMEIEVRLFATLRQGRFSRQRLEVGAGATVTELLTHLAIAATEVAILLVNGQEAARDRVLEPGDTVSLFPALGGG